MGTPQAKVFQSCVVGLGAMGSAAAFHLSKTLGNALLGIESQPTIPHTYGSSHGESRIIRHIYQEHPSYVPLLTRSYELFKELEHLTSQRILITTGCLNISSASMEDDQGEYGHSCFDGAVSVAQQLGLPHTVYQSSEEIESAFPGFQLPAGYKALFDPTGGFVVPEKTIESQCSLAKENGATILTSTTVLEYSTIHDDDSTSDDPLILIRTTQGDFKTKSLVITAGHEMTRLVPSLAPVLTVERQVVGWFRPQFNNTMIENSEKESIYSAGQFPVYLLDDNDGNYYYGFPQDSGGLLKLGKYHHLFQTVDNVHTMDRAVHAEDEQALRFFFNKYMPKYMTDAPMEKSSVCTFTNTPDGHFIIDHHPQMKNVVLVSACSGHGFKMSPVVGEIASELVLNGESKYDIEMFRLNASRKGFEHLAFN